MAEAEKKRYQSFSQVNRYFSPQFFSISYPKFSNQSSLHPHFSVSSVSLSHPQNQIFEFPFLSPILGSDIMVLSQEKDEEKDLDLSHEDHETPLPLTVTSRVNFFDILGFF